MQELQNAVQHVFQTLNQIDKSENLSAARVAVLTCLRQRGPRRVGELAERLGVSQPTMTQLVTGMQRDGLVDRRAHRADARATVVEMTPRGRDAIRSVTTRKAQWCDNALAELTASERTVLARALERLVRY